MGIPRNRKAANARSAAPPAPPATARQRRRQPRTGADGASPPDEDIEAQQHEIHGMIEDAMDPAPERGGTDIERE